MLDSVNYRINILSSGYYDISVSIGIADTTLEIYTLRVKNKSGTPLLSDRILGTGDSNFIILKNNKKGIYLEAGDYLEATIQSTTDTSYTLGAAQSNCFLTATKLSGSPTISAQETIGALYTGAPPTGTLGVS